MRRIPLIILFIGSFFLFYPITGSTLSFAGQHDNQEQYLLKSIFLERFCRFIEWPPETGVDSPDNSFIIGVIGDHPFNSILNEVYTAQAIKRKHVEIRHIKTVDEIADCHLLFIAATDDKSLKRIITRARDLPVLTVSDNAEYGIHGVHINMYVENEQIRFEINNNALKKSGLTVSSLLLKVARLVETPGGGTP